MMQPSQLYYTDSHFNHQENRDKFDECSIFRICWIPLILGINISYDINLEMWDDCSLDHYMLRVMKRVTGFIICHKVSVLVRPLD